MLIVEIGLVKKRFYNISKIIYMNNPCVVIDNGTGYTKMGYANNNQPAFDIPTIITELPDIAGQKYILSKQTQSILNFQIGDVARQMTQATKVNPIQSGVVNAQRWDHMQMFWHRSIYDYLRCDPSQTVFILTQPPLNPPENRQHIAEIMFETFNVKGLYIGVQAVLALIASSGAGKDSKLSYTGTVLDSGDGVTHIIPVVNGFTIQSCIKHIPLAGKNMTSFIESMLRERNERFPVQEGFKIAKMIKEKYSYIVPDGNLVQEFNKFDNRMKNQMLKKHFDKYINGTVRIKNQPYKVSIGPQRFLAPEMFFCPEIVDQKYTESIDSLVDKVIQLCPIDTRRSLYRNIILSGGSTLFKGFRQRLQNGVRKRVNQRLEKYEKLSSVKSTPIEVVAIDNPYQRYAVWLGGAILSRSPNFSQMYHSREQYKERGSQICRYNVVYQ